MAIWQEWWFWGALGVALAILEIAAPAFIFLGFGVGAGIVAAILGFGIPPATFLMGSLPWLLVAFAGFSVVAWLLLRLLPGVDRTKAKVIEHDIND